MQRHLTALFGPLTLLSLLSCSSLNQPVNSGTSLNPLDPAGSTTRNPATPSPTTSATARYTPGQWVETSMANSTFFKRIPKGNATADRVLPAATPLQVMRAHGAYVQVQLENGEQGFVPEIMVIERAGTPEEPIVPPIDPAILENPATEALPAAPSQAVLDDASLMIPDPAQATDPSTPGLAPEPEVPSLEQTGDMPAQVPDPSAPPEPPSTLNSPPATAPVEKIEVAAEAGQTPPASSVKKYVPEPAN